MESSKGTVVASAFWKRVEKLVTGLSLVGCCFSPSNIIIWQSGMLILVHLRAFSCTSSGC
jgi:hypothetical protein